MQFENVKSALEKKGYKVTVCENAKEAADYIDAQIDKKTVGMGGSVTIGELGIYERLSVHNDVYWHARTPEGKTPFDVIKDANSADIYISSVNGLAETGEIVNIDGSCNRISSMCYGHKKVIFVIGKNKLAPTYDDALYRARNIAAPKNAKRLGRKTPCAVNADKCYDCQSPDRICRVLSVWWTKPSQGEYEVVLINEELGY